VLTVHTIPGSPYARAVLVILEEKRQRYRLEPLTPDSLNSEEHLSRHPFGKVPVIEHEGFHLYETQAILRYLDRLLPEPPLTPRDIRQAARMDQVMNITDWYLFTGVSDVIAFERIVKPAVLGLEADEARVAAAMPAARRVISELGRLLDEHDFFCGDALSLADIIAAPHIDFLAQTPEWRDIGSPHRALCAWLERMMARPSFQATTWERVAESAQAV
jgi:glutathione S-transferase